MPNQRTHRTENDRFHITRFPLCFAIVAWVLFIIWPASAWTLDLESLDKSVVHIQVTGRGEKWTGSGSVVATNWVLTNEHVAKGARSVRVVSKHIPNGYTAEVVWQDADRDLALLKVAGLTLPVVKFATQKPGKGEEVWSIGFPGVAITDADSTFNKGVVSVIASVRRHWGMRGNVDIEVIQHDSVINRGNSGGPLFDQCGRQVGINSAGDDNAQGVFIAVRITEAIPHLNAQGVSPQQVATPCTPSDNVAGLNNALQQAEQATRISIITGIFIGALSLLACILALRKPRQKIIKVIERISRPIRQQLSQVNLLSNFNSTPTALVLTGFDAAGKKMHIKVPASGASAAGGYVIGRHAALVDYVIENQTISRRHLRILVENGQSQIEDINSANGTRVNNIRLKIFKQQPLTRGDTIVIGDVELRVSA